MPVQLLELSDRITAMPVIHGSGDMAVAVRRVMLDKSFDCLAVPLPPSFQADVESAVGRLPAVTAVIQRETSPGLSEWSNSDIDEDDEPACSYVPLDPCQPIIAALRIAIQERIPRAFVDLETARFESSGTVLPDPYALKNLSLERFAAGTTLLMPPPQRKQRQARIACMAAQVWQLEKSYSRILLVCSIEDWGWIRGAYNELAQASQAPASVEDDAVEPTETFALDSNTLLFLLGELPFVTSLYERARAELDSDENLTVDGLKELLLATRSAYEQDLGNRRRNITPQLLSVYLKYVRNLSLVHRRITPDLYTLVVAAQQILGDQFAVHLTETARHYGYQSRDADEPLLEMGVGRAKLPDGTVCEMKNRLPGPPVQWKSCRLNRRPPKIDQSRWKMQWNPYRQCSWPPEDQKIEQFRSHVKDAALAIMGHDLARTEKFTTSLLDGLDVRETLRHWHTGDLYVKVHPPTVGTLDCVVMLFDSPADPRDYPWRITWHAEHQDESTLALFATDFHEELVGPGIALATYGGAMFLFPARPVPEIWRDRRFDFADTLEERLLAAACYHAQCPQVALLSHAPPGAGWRRLAKHYRKKLVHVPLSRFSGQMIQQLRMFHVLNGQQVRSYAEHFIRRA